MFKVRQKQFLQFDTYIGESFRKRMEAFLQEKYPSEVASLPREHLKGFVEDGIRCAGRFAIEMEDDTARFLEMLLLLGLDFDENPDYVWTRSMLESPEPASDRLDKVFETLQFDNA